MTEEKKPGQEQPAKKPARNEAKHADGKVAVILVRNTVGASGAIRDTLTMLRLQRKLTCSVWDKTPAIMGMFEKVKDYATYGDIDAETLKQLEDKRGNKDAEGRLKNHFHLHPPRGGFERKGIKLAFSQGGALGNRSSNMSKLISRMI